MENKADKRKGYKKPYEPVQNQNFLRKDFKYSNCEDYNDMSFGKFKNASQYKYNKDREREFNNHFNIFNITSSNNREVHNVPSNINKKISPWSEEAAEEERKRLVSDTANELKNKLKMWNTVKGEKLQVGEDRCSRRTVEVPRNDVVALPVRTSEYKDNELINMNNISIVQQSGQSLVKDNNKDGKNFYMSKQEMSHKSASSGMTFKINSNKSHKLSSISQNRQKKIQQSLIGDLMAIPKANLKKVLINPQTHPKIEQKMAQIVKENRLLLAQKFRSLAESKINQQGQFVCSKFVDDVGDLIDSDLAVDLCQLPPELITQISDIFQLDFDDSMKIPEVQENCNSVKNIDESYDAEITLNSDENSGLIESSIEDRVSEDKAKDVPVVEPGILCNAVPNDPLMEKVTHDWDNLASSENVHSNFNVESIETNPQSSFQSSFVVSSEKAITASDSCDMPEGLDLFTLSKCFPKSCETLSNHCNNCDIAFKSPYVVDEHAYLAKRIKLEPRESREPDSVNENTYEKLNENTSAEWCGKKPEGKKLNLRRNIARRKIFNTKKSAKEKSIKDRSDTNTQSVKRNFFENENPLYKSIESQTEINLVEADHSQPFLGHLYSESTEKSLLREVQMIDDLLHRLNQRRFIIFLKLVGLESCNLNKNNLKTSLMQTITNGDANLMKKLSLGAIKNCETKRNAKKKKNFNCQKNASKKGHGIKNIVDVNMRNHAAGVNIQDPVHSRRKCGGKTGYTMNGDEYL